MAKNSIDAYGAAGKSNVLFFRPEDLTLVSDPAHPLYDERIHEPLDEAMVLNIMDQGVLQPIVVWKDPEIGCTCVVAGRRRVRHAVEANVRLTKTGKDPILVPAVVRRGSAVRMSQAMVSENEIRRADSPLGRAKKMAAMLERGHDESDLALYFGCGVQTVHNTLALLDCSAPVLAAIEAGQVTATQARDLAAMPPVEQKSRVDALVAAGEGVKPHERARRQRAVMGNDKPRMRTRKQVEAALAKASGPYADALRWVLGGETS